jgi:pimeloyl-ACP methyl ester carboxylesterase
MSEAADVQVRALDVALRGLTHRVTEWSAGDPREATRTALLLHGFMDAGGTWDLVAPHLARAGLRVLAPDLRGYGDGARVGAGGYYYFPDYVLDVADLVDELVPAESRLVVVGHSMGGTVATLYSAVFPARVGRLVLAEGLGPPDNDHALSPDRMRGWIDGVRTVRSRGRRTMPSREEALDRLAFSHPRVPRDVLRTRIDALVRELPDGSVTWKADPLHTTSSPVPFFAESFKAFARRVECPTLFVAGGPHGWHPPDEADRLSCFRTLSRLDLPDAGHMMHWTHPDVLADAIRRFVDADA